MRKINKSEILSKKYEKWLHSLRTKKKEHKTCSEYKNDVIMSLLYCQKGVCAYTEMLLCSPKLITIDKWNTQKYKDNEGHKKIGDAHLEHFNPILKGNYYCEWSNLFMVWSKVNVLKNNENSDLIKEFKPDLETYNPNELLDYDLDTNRFIAKTDKEEATKIKIKKLIDLLGINHYFVVYERECFFKKYQYSKEIDRFFTAFEMSKKYLNTQ